MRTKNDEILCDQLDGLPKVVNKGMTFFEALDILMQSASRDVEGQGCGFRTTTDEWREKVRKAWRIVFRHMNKRDPTDWEMWNAHMR
jgi:hypothetical protein